MRNPAEVWIGSIKAKLWRRNKSVIVLFHGDLGSGKSYSAMSLALEIQSDWTPDKGLVFRGSEFIHNLMNAKKGDALIWDEAGVGMSARDWMTMQNKLTGAVLQTCRTKNLCIIVTTPSESFIDIQMRKLFNVVIEPYTIDFKNNTCRCKILLIQTNKQTGNIYRKFPRIRFPDGILRRMPYIEFLKPPEKISNPYDNMRDWFTNELNKMAEMNLKSLEIKALGIKNNPKREARKMFKSGMKPKQIAKEFDVTSRTVYNWVKPY